MIISRNLSKRVQKLETRLIPTEEPRVVHIVYVSPDGTRTDGPRITCAASPSTPDQRTRA